MTHVSVCDTLREISIGNRRRRARPLQSLPLQLHNGLTLSIVHLTWHGQIMSGWRAVVPKTFARRELLETSGEQVQGAPRVAQSTSRLIKPSLLMLVAALVHRSRANSPAHPTSPANPHSHALVAGPSDQRGLCPDPGESCTLVATGCPPWSLPLGLGTGLRCAGPCVRAAAKVKHPVSPACETSQSQTRRTQPPAPTRGSAQPHRSRQNPVTVSIIKASCSSREQTAS